MKDYIEKQVAELTREYEAQVAKCHFLHGALSHAQDVLAEFNRQEQKSPGVQVVGEKDEDRP